MEHNDKTGKRIEVSLDDLIVNPNNARFIVKRPKSKEIETIDYLLFLEGNSMVDLAKEININGLYKSDNIIITDHERHKGKFTVLEGNRRISSLKLMSTYKNRFDEFRESQHYISDFKSLDRVEPVIEAVYYKNPLHSDKVIRSYHEQSSKGKRSQWDPQSQERNAETQGKITKSIAIFDLVQKSPYTSTHTKNRLATHKGWFSKIQHVSKMETFKTLFGITYDKNNNVTIEYDLKESIVAMDRLLSDMMIDEKNKILSGTEYFNSPLRFESYMKSKFPLSLLPDRRKIAVVPKFFNSKTKLFSDLDKRTIQDCPYYNSELHGANNQNAFLTGTQEDTDSPKDIDSPKDTDSPKDIDSPKNTDSPKNIDSPQKGGFSNGNKKSISLISSNDFTIPHSFKKSRNLHESLSQVHMGRHTDLIAIGLRSLIEYSLNNYLILVKNDHKTPYNPHQTFVKKIDLVLKNLSATRDEDYGEISLRKRLPKVFEIVESNPKTDYKGMPALHLFVHHHDYIAEVNQVENIYQSFKDFLSIIWKEIAKKI